MIRIIRWIVEIPARRRARRAQRQLAEEFRVIDEQRDKLWRELFPPGSLRGHEDHGTEGPGRTPSVWLRKPGERDD
jgi:hypothetical protein